MPRKILIVTGDAGESYETLYALHRFQEAGDQAVIAAPSVRRLHLVMHDFEPGWDTYVERTGYGCDAQITIAEAKSSDYDAILLIGGRAPEYLRHNEDLLRLVNEFNDAGKWVWAICHGIQILVAAGLVQDRCVTCYEHVRFEVAQAGGTWDQRQAVRDGRIITAQTWQSHPDFYRLIFNALSE
ncbi:MAG: DJ-1/PfpI family protein [Bryobacteraceae bacterium]|nr:DJ-1/PfpI family protein [Bryobacteraceae bacterium]